MTRCCVAVIAKHPTPGRVKTRLAASVGADAAARLCEAFLRDTLQTLAKHSSADRCLFFDPPEAEAWFEELDPQAVRLLQPELPFGDRLHQGFQRLFELGYERVVFVGCDAPHISAHAVGHAFDALENADLTMGPTDDGGYYLVGMNAPHTGVFDHVAWSTATVLTDTLESAARLGLQVELVQKSFDIDQGPDLERLQREFKSTLPELCPRTAEALLDPD